MGFTIIRPTDFQRMGRTVLKPHIGEADHAFVTCRAEFCAHVLGQQLKVTGMPFIQQDTQVGACAQASLWMLARYMSRRFRTREFLPAEINQFAKSRNQEGRLLPAEEGLTSVQMLDALQAMGFSAELVAKDSLDFKEDPHFRAAFTGNRKKLMAAAKLADIAYRYIESGLPVIFATKNHAVVGIGHSYDSQKRVSLSIQRIPSFFVNDDASGPYREVPILRRKKDCRSFLDVEAVFVIAPHEATLRGEGAEEMARDSLSFLLKEDDLLGKIRAMRPDLAPMLSRLEYRTYLKPTVDLQAQLLSDIRKNVNAQVARKLLRLDYPKYVWVTEVSSGALLKYAKKEKRRCLGRILVDSTAPKITFGTMAIHFADFLMIHDQQKPKSDPRAWEKLVLPGSTPFVHMFTSDSPGHS